MKRLAALVAAVLVGAAAPAGLAGGVLPAAADPTSPCTLDTGTIVAVDFGHWGGPIVRGCGVNSPTGYTLLIAAHFTMAGTAHDGPAFICRIGNPAWMAGAPYPTPATEPCALTPPASAYWSYWLAPKGQHTWSYSNLGAMSDKPKPGEVELWHFGATNIAGTCGSGVPPYSPDALRPGGEGASGGNGPSCGSPRDRSEAASGRQTGATGGHRGGSGGGGGPGATGGTRHGAGTTGGGSTRPGSAPAGSPGSSSAAAKRPASSAAGTPAGTASSAASTGSSPTTAGSDGPTIVNARPASADTKRPSTGSLAPVLLGVTLALLLGGGAGWSVWRRRRASAE